MQIWAESGKSALPICNYSQILYQFLTFTQNLKRSRDRHQNSNNSDNDQELCQRESIVFLFHSTSPPHIIKCFLLKIQGFSTFHISVNKPHL